MTVRSAGKERMNDRRKVEGQEALTNDLGGEKCGQSDGRWKD